MKTKQEVVETLVPLLQGYIDDPSSCGYNPKIQKCVYLGTNSDGKEVKCIFGSCVTDEFLETIKGAEDSASSILYHLDKKDDVFKEEYKGISPNVWQRAQVLHDGIAINNGEVQRNIDIRAFINILNQSNHPGENIKDLGLKFPETT